jgi:hypothetical protein
MEGELSQEKLLQICCFRSWSVDLGYYKLKNFTLSISENKGGPEFGRCCMQSVDLVTALFRFN